MPRFPTAALAGLLLLAACSDGGSGRATPTEPGAPPHQPNLAPRTHTVDVQDGSFEPSFLRIDPGDSVRWVLRGSTGHWVTESEWQVFRVFLEKRGDSFEYRFGDGPSSAAFSYHCNDHVRMAGWICVGPPGVCGS